MADTAPAVRPARREDVPAVLSLIRELAVYERAGDEVETDEAALHAALFGRQPRVFADVAELDGAVAGVAVWFVTFSTWTGRHGIWLEDLVVAERHRRRGCGGALLAALAARAVEQGWTRLEWAVLDWNEPALAFYRSLGAEGLDEWTTHRLSGRSLASVASGAHVRSIAPDGGT